MKHSAVFVAALVPLAAILAIASCSGKTDLSGGGAPDATQGDSAQRPSDCPATAPNDGDACTHDQLTCEYGTDYDPRCNVVRTCYGGRWGSPVGFGGVPKCPTSPPTIPPNPSDCAATRAGVPTGMACTSTSTCNYDGATCFCGRYCPSYPIRQPDCDAGQTVGCCNAKVQWNCFDGPAYCPQPRPPVGSACTNEGGSCAISPPVECGQATLDCKGGVWQLQDYGCPVSSAKAKRDITYVDDETQERLRSDLMSVRLASYRYKNDDAQHLGFIIEDMPEGSPAVLASRDRVDLYGYVSMAVAAIKAQQREIDALKREVAQCSAHARK
jgi:hypothetical protein